MKTTIKRFTASLVMAVAVAAGTARAGVLFSDNFDDGFTSVANQYITGLSINYGQTPTGWVPAGDGAIHVVDRSGAGNWGLMFYEGGNVDTITTATTISGANASGNTYRVTFNLAPACYNGLGQDTTSADGIALQVLDSNGGVLGANTFLPGAFINQAAPGLLPFHAVTLDYTGTGVGAGSVNLNFAGYPAGGGRFGGAIDDVVVQTTVQWPGATSGNWSDGTKWTGGVAPVADDVVEVQGAGGGNMTNDIGSLAAGGIEFQSGAGAFTLSGNAIALDGNLNNLSANPQTVGLNLAINGLDNNSEFNAATNLVVSGIVSEVSAGSSLTKTGAGTLTLGGANTYSGNTYIYGGSLAVTGSGQIYTNSAGALVAAVIEIQPGTTLQVDRWDGGYGDALEPLPWGSGSFGYLSFDAFRIAINGGRIQYTGNSNIHIADHDGRGFTIGSSGATLEAATASQTWYINQDNRGNFGIASSAGGLLTLVGAGNGEIDKIIPGTGGVSKTGTGTWTLAGANTYSGNTSISGGTLAVTGSGQLYTAAGNAQIFVNPGATLQVDRWDGGQVAPYYPSPDPVAWGSGSFGVLNFFANQININGGTIRYTGTNNVHVTDLDGRGFTIGSLGATLEAATAGQTWYINQDNRGDFGIASSDGGLLTLAGAGNGEIDKIIPGTGGVSKTGTGTWMLAGTNTYTGRTTVNAGTLELRVAGAGGTGDAYVGNNANLQLDASAALNPNATLVLDGASSSVNLAFTGSQLIAKLSFDGGATLQVGGSWGAPGSGAANQDSHFTGSGILVVVTPFAAIPPAMNLVANGDFPQTANPVVGSPAQPTVFNINGSHGDFSAFWGNTIDLPNWVPYDSDPNGLTTNCVSFTDDTNYVLNGTFYLDTLINTNSGVITLNSAGDYLNGLIQTNILNGVSLKSGAQYQFAVNVSANSTTDQSNAWFTAALTVGSGVNATNPATAVPNALFSVWAQNIPTSGSTNMTSTVSGADLLAAQGSGPVNLIFNQINTNGIAGYPASPNPTDLAQVSQVLVSRVGLTVVAPPGDLNHDGVVDQADVNLAQSYLDGSIDGGAPATNREDTLINTYGYTPAQALAYLNLTAFDINGDGYFNASDVAALQAMVGVPTLNYSVVAPGRIELNWNGAYKLQWLTNALSGGLQTNASSGWVHYPDTNNPVTVTNDGTIPSAFFRLSQ